MGELSFTSLVFIIYSFGINSEKFLIKTMHTKAFSLPPSLLSSVLQGACVRVSGGGQGTIFRSCSIRSCSEFVDSLGGKPLSPPSHQAPNSFFFSMLKITCPAVCWKANLMKIYKKNPTSCS